MLFILRKILTTAIMPESIAIIFLILGVLTLWFSRKKMKGQILVTAGLFFLIFFSSDFVFKKLSGHLEKEYQPFCKETFKDNKNIKYIVVLGGGTKESDILPLSSKLGEKSLNRLIEAIMIHRTFYPESKLIFSGGSIYGKNSESKVMQKVADKLGIPKKNMILEEQSKTTEENVLFVKNIVKNDKFILVTSAVHMPRSMLIFQKYGMNPIPAPTAYDSINIKSSPTRFIPNVQALFSSTAAVHEYIGIAYIKIKSFLGF